jgi:1-phosphofructokinase family hexose kinase
VSALAAPGDSWVFSGSLPPGLPEDYYAALIQIVQANGAMAYLDSSRSALSMGIAASPYLVKPNRQEAEELTGIKIQTLADYKQTAAYFFDFGAQMVALSLGANGLFLTTPAHSVWVIPPRVDPINGVGPGDALLAGILYATANHLSLAEMARWGVACGTMAVVQNGVNFGTFEEVQNLVKKIEVVDEF